VNIISQPYEENQKSILSIFGRDNRFFPALFHHSFDFHVLYSISKRKITLRINQFYEPDS
jgi:hypothetical protein